MAQVQVSPSQAGPNRWDVFCDGLAVGPSLSRKEAFGLARRLKAGKPLPPTSTAMTTDLRDQISTLTDVGTHRATAAGRAFYVCWTGDHCRPTLAVTTDPANADQIVAVCRPQGS
jgi:hypothetical protein